MKTTLLTLASVAALAGAVNAQTINGLLTAVDIAAGTGTYDYGGIATSSFSGGDIVSSGGVGTTFYTIDANAAPNSFAYTFNTGVIGAQITFADWDFNNTSQITFSGLGISPADLSVTSNGPDVLATFSGLTLNVEVVNSPIGTDRNGAVTVSLPDGISSFGYNHSIGNGLQLDSVSVRTTITGVVPEPSSTALLGLGALGLIGRRKRA